MVLLSLDCWLKYKKRSKSIIIVDFDTVIADIRHITRRGGIYIQNHPDKSMDDYLDAHLGEQQPISAGIKKVWDLQSKHYRIVFKTNRSELFRVRTSAFLNSCGLCGELHMDIANKSIDTELLVHRLNNQGFKVVGILSENIRGVKAL